MSDTAIHSPGETARIGTDGLPIALTEEEQAILPLLRAHTYEEVERMSGWSRGRIYRLALRTGARKTERRIQERAEERRRRQAETLAAIVGNPVNADVLDFLDGLPATSENGRAHV